MLCLGIESTAHTFGCSVVEFDGKKFNVLSNVRDMLKTEKGGLVPVQISEHHLAVFDTVIAQALEKSNKKIEDINLIAFSQGPGIGHALRIGSVAARSLALQLKLPLIGVNHCVAHLEIATIYNSKDPVLLYASGANTQVIAYDGGKYRVFGETLDTGIGNFLDTFARDLGLGFPGGPIIDQMAQRAKERNNFTELPYQVKGMDVSFSGIHTYVRKILKENKLTQEQIEDLCYSVQETVFAMLIEVSERAMAHCEKNELVLGGGVACNTRLREMAQIMCKERNAKCIIPENQYLVDNAAMIGLLGIKMYNAKNITRVENSKINPYERTDDIKVNWK
ncbi:MAG TPA: bifunctional N(6)-L-threonylcarbamoyladenine synthase/serine/threonine protein kinase [Alphaproteobacteria bacterium]|nr:bifunctional N(6)-L-threonylcarbamoyladenine synthase/serine/threonine protein kinase [Alphaproteobacteria bacterium]